MYDILDDPKLCPHGNPFPGYEALTKDWISLVDIPVGTEVTIRRIHEFAEDNEELLSFFGKKKVEPGKKAHVKENLSFNETLTIELDGNEITLGFAAAKHIFVEVPAS